MGNFVKGDVVVLPFPFSDLSGSKRRPAFVLAVPDGPDAILCQITSRFAKNQYTVSVEQSDFVLGSLPLNSFVRTEKIFTADKSLFLYTAGHLSDNKIDEISGAVVKIILRG